MLEILQDFQRTAVLFSPPVLIITGIALVLIGLLLWLGGLGLRKPFLAAAAAICSALCSFFIIAPNLTLALVLAAITALIAIIFERIFIIILAAALAALIVSLILAIPYIEPPKETLFINHQISKPSLTLSTQGTLKTIKVFAFDFIDKIKNASSKMPPRNWAIIAATPVIVIIAGIFIWRFISALSCSALGAIFIFAGMISLLLYKRSAPITAIYGKSSFYLAVFVAMLVFGACVQLLLCKSPKKQRSTEKKTKSQNQEPEPVRHLWRTS